MRTLNTKTVIVPIIALLIALGATGCIHNHHHTTDVWDASHSETYSDTMDAAGILGLFASTINGSIDLRTRPVENMIVETRIVVRADTEHEAETFANTVDLSFETDGDVIYIYNDYPDPPSDVQIEVSYEIFCPEYLALTLGTVNGSIDANGIVAAMEAVAVNGSIDLAGRGGPFSLTTVNGSVRATIEELEAAGHFSTTNGSLAVAVDAGVAPIHMESLNGNTALTLHDDFCGWLDAATSAGHINSNIQLGGDSGSTPFHVWGAIGGGCSTTVTVFTSNGQITLRQ